MTAGRIYVPLGQYVEDLLPANLIDLPAELDDVWIEPPAITDDPFQLRTAILVDQELRIGIPGVDAVALVVAPAGNASAFMLEVDATPTPAIRLVDVPIALRFSSDVLKPARRGADGISWEADPTADQVDVTLAKVTVSVDLDGNVAVDAGISIDLPASMIGDTGIVIEAKDIRPYLDGTTPPPGKPAGWRGVHIASASLSLPGDLGATVGTLSLTDAFIGNGGFSGTVADTWSPPLAATLFGAQLELDSAALTFVQNSLTQSEIKGQITVPFFDGPAAVDIGINVDGSFAVRLDSADGLVSLDKPGLLAMELDSLGFSLAKGTFSVSLSGKLTPELGGLDWPTFELKDLSIDSEGNVHLDGGWLDLPDGYALDLFGFTIEVTKVGFGKTDDGGKWVGFSGGISLVTGLPAGASVDGLRVTWFEDGRSPQLTLNGVGVEFEIPDVLLFKGAVAYHELPGDVHRFDGALQLAIEAIDLEIDGQIVIGSTPTYTFLAIYVDAELPAGIPLGNTGIGLYGMAGLFALNMEPGKTQDQDWFAIPPTTPVDWYHQTSPGVSTLTKWTNREGSLAFGAGVTLGTESDNGFTFAAKVLLAIVFPGPIVMIDGAANLLKERASLDEDPIFRVLAILDARAGSITLGLDAAYKYDTGGELVDIHGSAETFFSYADPSLWFIHVGERDPKTKRIHAKLFQIFDADAYVMLDPTQFAMGAWIGLDKHWHFGPVGVDLEAWLEGNALLSFKPPQFHGDLTIHGKVAVTAFGVGVSAILDTSLTADVFHPFHIVGKLHAALDLPWPLPDFSADVSVEWGPNPSVPPLPVPLKEIAVEHLKVTTSWPLSKGTPVLVPDYDAGDGFLGSTPPPDPDRTAAPPAGSPTVPMDSRPHITFTRAVNDDALVGVNAMPRTPEWEQIGDPTKGDNPVQARYGLAEIDLDRWDAGASAWLPLARKGATANPAGVPELYGSWAPVPAMPGGAGDNPGQTKLWLWSNTPFDFVRHTSGSWADWFGSAYPDYPCASATPETETCLDFADLDPSVPLTPLWEKPGSGVRLGWVQPVPLYPIDSLVAVDGLTRALCFPGKGSKGSGGLSSSVGPSFGGGAAYVVIILDAPADEVVLTLESAGAEAIALGEGGVRYGPFTGGTVADPTITITGAGLRAVLVVGAGGLCLFRVCARRAATGSPSADESAKYEQHLRDALATWSAQGYVFEPRTDYRLTVVTTLDHKVNGAAQPAQTQTQLAFFRTDGPPGIGNLSLPANAASAAESTLLDRDGSPIGVDGSPSATPVLRSVLNSLAPYVDQTIPPTVPAAGQRPSLPRPVYRAYDVGVRFNEDYVDLLYRLDRRDLGVYLYDANNRPVRDPDGRLVVLGNPWGTADQLSLSDSDTRWIESVNASDCATLDVTEIPHTTTMSAGAADQVLAPDFVYEARLVPLLLHDDFAGYPAGSAASGPSGELGPWSIADDGSVGGPSSWQIGSGGSPVGYFLTQASPIAGPPNDPADPHKPGTVAVAGDAAWTDVRLSVYVRSDAGGAVGVVFRYQDANAFYRFSMDHVGGYRRLVRVVGGITTRLAEDTIPYPLHTDILVTVEAIGSSLSVYLDGTLAMAADDAALATGRIGLSCRADSTAAFTDVRVDDFRAGAPTAYRFSFTTSTAVDFLHHLHSFDDRSWSAPISDDPAVGPQVDAALAAAVAPTTQPPDDAEAKAYEALAALALGQASAQDAAQVEASLVTRGGDTIAMLVRSPEPIDWARTDLAASLAAGTGSPGTAPGPLKVIDVVPGSGAPADASATVLVRASSDLDGILVEALAMPGAPIEPARPALFRDRFGAPGGVLFDEAFGAAALGAYTVVDQGTQLAPSSWAVTSGAIVQSSGIYGGAYQAAEDGKPGTMAVTGSAAWSDVRVTAMARPAGGGAVGVAFRYADGDNHYRFGIDARFGYRRLVRRAGGVTTVLWEDAATIDATHDYRIVVDAVGTSLVVRLDGELLCAVQDGSLATGRAGLYAWLDAGASFTAFRVESAERSPVAFRPALADLTGITPADDPAAVGGPSAWVAANGELDQISAIGGAPGASGGAGTWAAGGPTDLDDVRVAARVRSDSGGAVGVMFRVRNADAYYRLALDGAAGRRRLVKVSGGSASVLWEDASQGLTTGRWYRVVVEAVGPVITASLDGTALFTVVDGDIAAGQVAVYASGAPGARFADLSALDLRLRAGAWRFRDDAAALGGPSNWSIGGGALAQTSALGGGGATASGTFAVVDGRSFADARLTVRLQADDPHPIGVVVRYRGPGEWYRFILDQSLGQRRLEVLTGGTVTRLWSDTGGFSVGVPMTITVDAAGDRLVGYVDGTLAFDVRDPSLASGSVGVFSSQNPGLRVLGVEVEAPPLGAYALLTDRFGAGDVTDWQTVDQGTLGGPSAWAAHDGAFEQTASIRDTPDDATTPAKLGTMALAGDPAWSDVVLSVRLAAPGGGAVGASIRCADAANHYRFSIDGGRGYRRLVKFVGGVVTTLWEDAAPVDRARTCDLTLSAVGDTLRGLLDGVPVFVVRDGELASGGVALYAWGAGDARFSGVRVLPGPGPASSPGAAAASASGWAIDDQFAVLAQGRWTFTDESATGGPSTWAATGGALVEPTPIGGGAGAGEPDMPGTYATAGDPAADCRVSAAVSGSGSGAVGVVARFVDADNYYRLSLDAVDATARLVKKVAGTVTLFWASGLPLALAPGRDTVLTLDAVGTRLSAWLDGRLLCDLEDADLPAGQAGVYAAADAGARCSDFRLGAPAWAHLYRFHDERTPADGRRLVIAGGPPDASATSAPGTDNRFAAGPGERGWAPSADVPSDLRLVAASGAIVHEHRFRPASSFAAVAFKVLRKADGTAFFIVPASGSSLVPGTYRLALEYRRDNRAVDPGSLVLSRAGDTTDEHVVIDVPWLAAAAGPL